MSLFLFLVIFAGVWIVYGILVLLLHGIADRSIKKASNTNAQIDRKRSLVKQRKTCLTFTIIASIILTVYYTIEKLLAQSFYSNILWIALPIAMISGLIWLLCNRNLMANERISLIHVDDFLRDGQPYALYLRGFEDDKYYDKPPISCFSEVYLAQVCERGLGLKLCAVGVPKELDTPLGAMRVYIDDCVWQDKVSELMRGAQKIFILINDTDSCIWEVLQCRDIIDKCLFIIDNKEKFMHIRSKLTEEMTLFGFELPEDFIGDMAPYYFSIKKPLTRFNKGYLAYNDMADVHPPVSLGDPVTPGIIDEIIIK